MKINRLGWVLGLTILLSAGRVMAAGDFEGEVDMKMTHGDSDKAMVMQYYVKGNMMRTQMDSPDGKFSGGGIFNLKTHEMTTIMDKQKMYMVTQLHPENFTAEKDHHFKMAKTGNAETILGYSCQEWDYSSDNDTGKVWFAPGIGNWWGASMAAQSNKLPADQKALVNLVQAKKLFPMKWQTADISGKMKGGMEVVKVEKKSLDSSLFEVPAGYKKINMPSFGGDGSGKKPTKEDLMKMMEQFKK